MHILFKPFGPLRRVAGSNVLEIEVPDNATVNDSIQRIIETLGDEIKDLIINGDRINGNLLIMLNKRDINTLEGLETTLKDGDEIAILPHVQGGWW